MCRNNNEKILRPGDIAFVFRKIKYNGGLMYRQNLLKDLNRDYYSEADISSGGWVPLDYDPNRNNGNAVPNWVILQMLNKGLLSMGGTEYIINGVLNFEGLIIKN